jgi:hypothetical protein
MRSRTIVRSLACLAILALAYTVPARAAAPAVKWALVNMTETTWIAGRFVSGPVMFEHDDARMARGEPCTRVLRFVPGEGPAEELVAFHCKPRWGQPPDKFKAATDRLPDGVRVLTEYQFAGDDEAHGVPSKAR